MHLRIGAGGSAKVQGPVAEVVRKAASAVYEGRRYDEIGVGARRANLVDFYTRGLLDEPEATKDWAPDMFRELPLYGPVSKEVL